MQLRTHGKGITHNAFLGISSLPFLPPCPAASPGILSFPVIQHRTLKNIQIMRIITKQQGPPSVDSSVVLSPFILATILHSVWYCDSL